MKFYDALQLDPSVLKKEIRNASTPAQRHKIQLAMVVRSLLIVGFSIAFIAPLSTVFGTENSPMSVALVCIILGIRFVDFGYCIGDSLRNLAIVLLLLLAAPVVAANVNPVLAALVHFGAFFTILAMTSDQPELGNGGIYSFAYVYLSGNPVVGMLFWKRCLLTLLGYLICAAILYHNHRDKNKNVRFRQLAARFNLRDRKCQWQFQLALGVGLMLALGSFLNMERFMWAGFACASLLGCYSSSTDTKTATKIRFVHRIVGVVSGSLLYALAYYLVPESFHMLFGPVGGICMGFCTDYRYKTAVNCFGALMLATGLYGMQGSVMLRIVNNFLGAVFGYAFYVLYQYVLTKHLEKTNA